MKQLLVEVRIHRIHCEGGDRYEVVFAYGDAKSNEVKLPMELDWDTAADSCYFTRKAVSRDEGTVFYDFMSKQFFDSIDIVDDISRMFYRVDCCDESELRNILLDVHVARQNPDLQGKVTVRWAGETTLVPQTFHQSGDKISLMYLV